SHGGVESGEQSILHQDPCPGEPVEQAGLSGVGVPGDGYRGDLAAAAYIALDVPGRAHVGESAAQLGDLVVDAPSVGLDLGLTGSSQTNTAVAAATGAAALTGQCVAACAESGQQIIALSQFDLGLALAAAGVLGEDVEDQCGAVDDLDLNDVLELDELAGR